MYPPGKLLAFWDQMELVRLTTFYMIVGLVRPDQGNIFLDRQDITDLPMFQRARCGLTYLPQEPSVFRKLNGAGEY